jgi:hypothetical protein
MVLGELIAAALERLLAGRADHRELTAQADARAREPIDGREHRRQPALHVGGAAAVVPVSPPLAQGVDRHPVEGNGVHVPGDAELGTCGADHALDVDGALDARARAKPRREAHLGHQLTANLHDGPLVARHARDRHETLEEGFTPLSVVHDVTRLSGDRSGL